MRNFDETSRLQYFKRIQLIIEPVHTKRALLAHSNSSDRPAHLRSPISPFAFLKTSLNPDESTWTKQWLYLTCSTYTQNGLILCGS